MSDTAWAALADDPDGVGLDALAAQATGLSDPNPRVACRLLLRDGQRFEGHTQAAGGPHAEAMALRAAQAAGADTRGATAIVTLEPCSHHGRTPPCCDALVAAGVQKVLVALPDPNPLVAGQGMARLRAAGVEVVVLPREHPLALASHERNIGFFSRMVRGRPWVRLKIAASLDGATALANGRSQWITGASARADGHAWRRRAGAVLTGIGTVLQDNPRLDVREVATARQPVRVVLDSRGRLSPQARIVAPPGPVWLYTAQASAERCAELAAVGVETRHCPDALGTQVDLAAVLADLGQRGVNELHIEAGQTLNGAWLSGGWVDEVLLYLAPKFLGRGAALAQLGPFQELSEALGFVFTEACLVGEDLRVRARQPQRFV